MTGLRNPVPDLRLGRARGTPADHGGRTYRARPAGRRRAGILLTLASLFVWSSDAARAQQPQERPGEIYAGTFSIVAVDAETGEIGVAVTSRVPCVGNIVPHVRVGVGAVATQALIRIEYGAELLDLVGAGMSPADALERALLQDAGRDHRQIGIIAAGGRSAQHTGRSAIAWAGQRSGRGYATQGNVLVGGDVLEAVSSAFEKTAATGMSLAERLIEALSAGDLAGGDRRKGALQSAALVVADPRAVGQVRPDGITAEIDVCESEDPVRELRRVYNSVTGKIGYRTLQQFHGPDVVQLKVMLHALGYFRRDAPEVRLELSAPFYTEELVRAVNAFRESHGLAGPADGSPPGLVDMETIELMWRDLEQRGIAAEVRHRMRDLRRVP